MTIELEYGVALEFTRDSPLFRQQLAVHEETVFHFNEYCKSTLMALQQVMSAISELQTAQANFALMLRGNDDKDFGRSLFTTCLPSLGHIGDILFKAGEVISVSNRLLEDQKKHISESILGPLESLLEYDFQEEKTLHSEMELNCSKYESLLSQYLSSFSKVNSAPVETIIQARLDYELKRFDLVSLFNKFECRKKVTLAEIACAVFGAFAEPFETSTSNEDTSKYFHHLFNEAEFSKEVIEYHNILWSNERLRLENEIQGCLPPPGSPPGASSPIQPRATFTNLPLFSRVLTSEVLSYSSKSVDFEDTRHAKDDGVFKQGYLWYSTLFKKTRKWYRLFGTKLYVVEVAPKSTTSSLDIICDVMGAQVIPKNDIPYKFCLTTADGKSVEFQAENEDEKIKWICSLRRCARGYLDRPKELRGLDGVDDALIAVRNGPSADIVRSFLVRNPQCAECFSPSIRWISTNLGISLCEKCAVVHRQLTWDVSHVKNIHLDHFHDYEISLALNYLGNRMANQIWEHSIPPGWTKLSSTSSTENRSSWILAKYYWFAFVEDGRYSTEELIERFVIAIKDQNIGDLYWLLAHRIDVNCMFAQEFDYGERGTTSGLHIAVTSNANDVVCFLLQNGARYDLKDSRGITALELAKAKASYENNPSIDAMVQMMSHIIDGEY